MKIALWIIGVVLALHLFSHFCKAVRDYFKGG